MGIAIAIIIVVVVVVGVGVSLGLRRRKRRSAPPSEPTPARTPRPDPPPMTGLEDALAKATDRSGTSMRDRLDAESAHVDELRITDDTGPILRRALDRVNPAPTDAGTAAAPDADTPDADDVDDPAGLPPRHGETS